MRPRVEGRLRARDHRTVAPSQGSLPGRTAAVIADHADCDALAISEPRCVAASPLLLSTTDARPRFARPALPQTWPISGQWKYHLEKRGEEGETLLVEAIFSIPTRRRPIPNATASANFRVTKVRAGPAAHPSLVLAGSGSCRSRPHSCRKMRWTSNIHSRASAFHTGAPLSGRGPRALRRDKARSGVLIPTSPRFLSFPAHPTPCPAPAEETCAGTSGCETSWPTSG